MIQHYFKIAFRNILKYKAQSIISILGLAVGFTCFALATLWIHYEMTYDDSMREQIEYILSAEKILLKTKIQSLLHPACLTQYTSN